VGVQVQPWADPALPGRENLVRFSYDRLRWGDRICLSFEAERGIEAPSSRWRAVARALWIMVHRDPGLSFHQVPVNIGDLCAPEMPAEVFAFARLRGTRRPLVPCPNLLRGTGHLPRPLPWDEKTDTVYFRGVDTGLPTLDQNARVALCRTARAIPGADCRFSKLVQFHGAQARQVLAEGLVHRAMPLAELNRHRFLVDCDGNSTSWDRYLHCGHFGGVPILFEPAWEECWHHHLADGENCLVADRHTLGAVVARLRAEPAWARRIAGGAARLVAQQLGTEAVQGMFEQAWRRRLAE
jgi:hypothetical protein